MSKICRSSSFLRVDWRQRNLTFVWFIRHFMLRGVFLLLILFCIILPWSVYPIGPIRYTDSIERIVRQTKDKKRQIELLLAATKQLKLTDPDKALEFASRALSLENTADYPGLRLQAMVLLGIQLAQIFLLAQKVHHISKRILGLLDLVLNTLIQQHYQQAQSMALWLQSKLLTKGWIW